MSDFDIILFLRWNFIQWVVQVRANIQDLLSKNNLAHIIDIAYLLLILEIVEPKDLMQNHGDHECSRPKTDFRHIRIIQQSWRNYEQRPESMATKIWNDLKADDYPDDKKFSA
ncbi:10576_t:CDS:2 [Entrophospora sp. SA101]|nr:10576_t:CDS:2 [Entrophospora sp. SA101]